jgi:hypothetical protein
LRARRTMLRIAARTMKGPADAARASILRDAARRMRGESVRKIVSEKSCPSSFRGAPLWREPGIHFSTGNLGLMDSGPALRASRNDSGGRNIPTQTKKDQLALALLVARTDPIPSTPGGWGLRNPEPKGPGQRTQLFSQCRAAGAGRKSGDTMIPANDPVTVRRDRVPPLRVFRFAPGSMGCTESSSNSPREPLAVGNGWRNHAIVMIRGSGDGFRGRDHAVRSGGAP